MTSAEARQRLILSRHTLKKFVQLGALGRNPDVEDLPLIEEEISTLDQLSARHPDLRVPLEALITEWSMFKNAVAATRH